MMILMYDARLKSLIVLMFTISEAYTISGYSNMTNNKLMVVFTAKKRYSQQVEDGGIFFSFTLSFIFSSPELCSG